MQATKKRTPAHLTRAHQRHARSKVSSESCSRNGAKGARATIERYGFDPFFERWRAWKLQNPSQPELLMIGLLSTLKVEYDREWRIGESYFTLDFYLPGLRRGIEVHGRIHGTLKQQQRAENDAKKRALLERLGIEVLWIDHQDLQDVGALIYKLQGFIAPSPRYTEAERENAILVKRGGNVMKLDGGWEV